jgi:endoplasmic reticulum junction formation protein lunapark
MASSPTAADAAVDHKGKEEKEKRGGVLGRMWRALFGGREDFEKRLQYLSKEEAAVHARMRRRTQFSRRAVRNLIVLSVLAEVFPPPFPSSLSFFSLNFDVAPFVIFF